VNDAARAKLDSLEFEDGAAWDEYLRFRSEKLVLNAIAAKFGISNFEYAKIESDPESIVQDLCRMIGVSAEKLVPGSAPVPIATRAESPTYRTFADRLDALLGRRNSDIEAATAKKVRALTGLGPADVEMLVADHAAGLR
jgi:hypothetical protein